VYLDIHVFFFKVNYYDGPADARAADSGGPGGVLVGGDEERGPDGGGVIGVLERRVHDGPHGRRQQNGPLSVVQ